MLLLIRPRPRVISPVSRVDVRANDLLSVIGRLVKEYGPEQIAHFGISVLVLTLFGLFGNEQLAKNASLIALIIVSFLGAFLSYRRARTSVARRYKRRVMAEK
jgi:hypothetical protein